MTCRFRGCDNLTSVIVKWKDPVTILGGGFDNKVKANATLVVPLGTLSAYEQAADWKGFKEIIEKGVVLNYEGYTLNNIGANLRLTATIIPENSINKMVAWTSSDEGVCTVVARTDYLRQFRWGEG